MVYRSSRCRFSSSASGDMYRLFPPFHVFLVLQGEVVYRFAQCKQPLTMRLMWNCGLPLPESQLDVLEPKLRWEELKVLSFLHTSAHADVRLQLSLKSLIK